jgi:hypothetical protein
MREPRSLLTAVRTEPLQPLEEVLRQCGRTPALVCQRDHPDASGLPVAGGLEHRTFGVPGGQTELRRDRRSLVRRTPTEERERDVQVLPRYHALAELTPLPDDERVEDVVGETQCTEEPLALIAADATRSAARRVCQLGVNCRRTRCSAVTAARERIASRSAG